MWTAIAILLLIASVAAHEAAHALALRRLGFRIIEVGVGIPIGPRLKIDSGRLPFRVVLSPILLGAYVMPDPDDAEAIAALPYRDRAWYSGAGVLVNLVIGTAALALVAALDGHWLSSAVTAAVGVVLWVARRPFCSYGIPVLGLPVLALTAWSLTSTLGQPEGPVGLVTGLQSNSLTTAILLAGLASIGLGLLNMLPMLPFDGGHVIEAALDSRGGSEATRWFSGVTGALSAALVLYVLGSDMWWLIGRAVS
jgi:Zn-dependent protease